MIAAAFLFAVAAAVLFWPAPKKPGKYFDIPAPAPAAAACR